MTVLILEAGLIIFRFLLEPLGISTDPNTGAYVTNIAVFIFCAWCFIWLPFSRHEKTTAAALERQIDLASEIAEFKENARPRFSVSGNKNLDGCSIQTMYGMTPIKYFRLIVENVGTEAAERCTASITRVSKGGVVVMGHEKIRITYYPGHTEEGLSKTIHGNSKAFLDVLAIADGETVLWANQQRELSLKSDHTSVFSDLGDYDLEIELVGSAPTMRVVAEFKWTGDLSTAELTYKNIA